MRVGTLVAACALCLIVLAGCPNPAGPVTQGTNATGSISGHARYSNQADSSGITISAESTDGVTTARVQRLISGQEKCPTLAQAIAGRAATDASGAYSVTGLAPGTYTVYASSNTSLEKAVTTAVTVTAGSDVTAADLSLTPTGSIAGKATLNGATSGNLGIVVFIAGTSYSALSANDGSFTLSDVPASTGYVLVASKEGYDSFTTSVDVAAGQTTTISPTMNLTPHVTPPATGSVSGTVELNGAASPGVFVYLQGTSSLTISGDLGAFSLQGVAPGTYVLVASTEGYSSASASVTVTAGGSYGAGILNLIGVQVSAPQFSPGAGTYSDDQMVTISDATPGATVYYTTDGSTPPSSPTSAAYSSPITLTRNGSSGNVSLIAVATKSGMTNSAMSAATYAFAYPSMTAQWAQTVDSFANASYFYSVAADTSGTTCAAGFIYGTQTVNFGGGVTAAGPYNGAANAVVVKYNSSGAAQWAATLSTASSISVFNSVACDSNGNVYAAGYVSGTGTYNFGGSSGTVTGLNSGHSVVLVKYNPAGQTLWATTLTSAGSGSEFRSVAVDANGGVYAAGTIGAGSFNFGGSSSALTGATSGGNVVLVKYNSSGTAQWAQTAYAGSAASAFNSVALDLSGSNIYAVGFISGTGSGPGTYYFTSGGSVQATGTCTSGSNVVLVKYNASGVAQTAQTVYGGTGTSSFTSVAVDSSGFVYAAGSITGTGTYNFATGSVPVTGAFAGASVVLVKYNSSGAAQWAKTATTASGSSVFNSVAVDSGGNIFAAGYLSGAGAYDFGSGAIAGTCSGSNVVIVRYDSASAGVKGAQTVTSGSLASGFCALATDGSWNVYAAGEFAGMGILSFGGSVRATGAYSSFNTLLVKYCTQ